MKSILMFLILISLTCGNLLADAEKEIKSEIKQVTVYTERAQIIRESSVDISSGTTTLRLIGLSPYIDPQSIQVKGFGDFIILSVNHQNNYLRNLEDLPEIKSIRTQIESLRLKVEDEKASISVLKEKEAFLVANRAILVKETTFTLEQLKSVMDLYTNNMEQVTMATLKKNRLIGDYEKQIAALQQQIADRTGKAQLPSGEVAVTVSANKSVSARFTISYVVTNAGWYPSYDIRVDNIAKPVTIFYKANVFQNTGVVWNNVKLSFSNATPWQAGTLPVLNPWFIDFYNPAPVVRGRVANAPARLAEVPAAAENVLAAKAAEAAPVQVQKSFGETTVSFDVSTPYTISSDGKVQTIEIQRTTSPAEYRYISIPKLSPLAYLTGNIADWAEQNLIGGEATLYFENTYVGKAYLNVNQLSDTLSIPLGNDNSLLIKREKRQDYTSRKVLGSNKTETYSFLITVRNNKANPVMITINDQIPLSTNSGIEVNASELSGGKLDAQTGKVTWDVSIKPSETRQLVLTYSVKYPKDKKVILE